jgi:hypothetical protein
MPLRRARRLVSPVLSLLVAGACAGRTPAAAPDAVPVRAAPAEPTPVPDASGLPSGFAEQFAAADLRARAVSFWLQCTATVARLRAEGTYGPAARAPRAIVCERTADGVPVGGVYDIDSAYTTVRRLQLVRLDGARPRYTDPVDTARLARAAKLARDVTVLVRPTWSKRGRPFSVVPVTVADGALEAWVIPRATKARSIVTGGDAGYTRDAAGALQLLVDRTTTWTQLNLPPTGPLRLYSSVRDVAAVSDLVSARFHTELGRAVTVSTPLVVSTLVPGLDPATGSRFVWQHSRVPVR